MLTINSYAKINLGLLLISKRPDGYHDIATLFQQIDLFDTLTFEKTADSFVIKCDNDNIPLDHHNLVWKAFDLFRNNYNLKGGLSVSIKKQIPAGGGLGGGSSNAAAALTAVNDLWNLKLGRKTLAELACSLGSDVPFFLTGGTAFGQGRGEKLKQIIIPDNWYAVLIFPDIHISTQWAYKESKIGLTNNENFIKLTELNSRFASKDLYALLRNDLEKPVFARYPVLFELKTALKRYGAFFSLMSGSGSTVFGLFETRQKAEYAACQVESNFIVKTRVCRPVSSPKDENRCGD